MAQKMPAIRINLQNVSDNPQWYTIVTKFNYEKKVASDIMNGLKNSLLDDQIFEVVVPIQEVPIVSTNKAGNKITKMKVEKIYPLYVFIKAKMTERVWDYIRNTTGVATILASGATLLVMSDEDILRVKDACGLTQKEKEAAKLERKNNIEKMKKMLVVGKEISVVDGVFKNYQGLIKKIDFNKNKVDVCFINGLTAEINIEDLSFGV